MAMEFQFTELYQSDQIKELEKNAFKQHNVSEQMLMERAGLAAYRALKGTWSDVGRITVLCGPGNNGGDGYVLARMAQLDGVEVRAFHLGETASLKGAALIAFEASKSAGVIIEPYSAKVDLQECELIVDAILGTGVDRDVTGIFLEAIEEINLMDAPVFALDIPSGLDADTGSIHGDAVVADMTITFIGVKQGLYTGSGIECSGEVVLDDLDLQEDMFQDIDENAFLLNMDELADCLGARSRDAHKGDFGHVLVVGGNYGMAGAARMAAEAAYRAGAGLVSVATRQEHVAAISGPRPEIMCHGVATGDDLLPLLDKASVVVLGPGLGSDDWATALFACCMEHDKPFIVDADGLGFLVKTESQKDWILTPHPGEASQLSGVPVEEIQRDRFAAIEALQEKFSGVVVLKGSGSLVLGSEYPVAVCPHGNPGMASGGMGDVLSGIIAGLVAQGLTMTVAAQAGVLVHSLAADNAAQLGERGLLATDLLPHIRDFVNKL